MKSQMSQILLGMLFISFVAVSPALAQFVVTTTLEQGPGSLRQAILDANADPNPSKISFNIPGNGPFTIPTVSDALPPITAPVTIDGLSQSGSNCGTKRINLDGSHGGLRFSNVKGGSVLRGVAVINSDVGVMIDNSSDIVLVCNNIGLRSDGMTVAGNNYGITVIGTSNNIKIGGLGLDKNIISGNISVDVFVQANGVKIIGNDIGLKVDGTAVATKNDEGIRADGNIKELAIINNVISNHGFGLDLNNVSNSTVEGNKIGLLGNGLTEAGNDYGVVVTGTGTNITIGGPGTSKNIISGNISVDVFVRANGVKIIGNDIGLKVDGTAVAAKNDAGIRAEGNSNNKDLLIANNIIAKHTVGIYLTGFSGSSIEGNLVGINVAGANVANYSGIVVSGYSDSDVINNIAINSNTVMNNLQNGITVKGQLTKSVFMKNNKISRNEGLGIDLNDDSVTLNDPGDGDMGPNGLLNFPVLNQATYNPTTGQLMIKMSLDVPESGALVQFFVNPSGADQTGYGEGEVFVGEVQASPGSQTVQIPFSGAASTLRNLSATTTTSEGTSEFSKVIPILSGEPSPIEKWKM